jgi:hypothetical protein
MKKTTFLLMTAGLCSLANPAGAAITDTLVGHWRFDETGDSTAKDSSSSANDGSVGNALGDSPLWGPGKIGNALTFRGPTEGSDYVSVPNFPRFLSVFSASAWVWADPRDGTWPQSTILENGLGSGGPLGLVIRSKNRDQQFGPLGNTSSDGAGRVVLNEAVGFPTDSWQHVGVTADGTKLRVYRNGIEIASADYDGTLLESSAAALGIGATLDDSGAPNGAYWQGKIDDVGVWSEALSASQMAAVYSAGLTGKDLTQADGFLNLPPTIATQPQGVTRFVGESVSFSVKAAGNEPLTYQWMLNSKLIPGATAATYTIASIKNSDAGQYVVVVTNPGGHVDSDPATLTVNSAGLNTGLIGYWKFDETGGDVAADSSSGNHAGTLGNSPGDDSQWVEGQIGGALQLGGPSSKQYVLVNDYAKPASTLTVSAWVFADALGSWASFVKNWGGSDAGQFHFGIFADGQHQNIYIKQTDGKTPNVSDPDPFPIGEWQHVAVVCDGSKVRLYRGGIEVASTDYDGTLVMPPMNCIGIGSKLSNDCSGADTGAPGFWQGKMDDVGIWNRGLSPQEIQAIFQRGQAGKALDEIIITDGLIGYFPLDETTGLTAADSSPDNHPGTLGGFGEDDSQWVEGRIGGSLQFGGPSSKQFVQVDDYAKPTSTLTVALWAFADQLGSWASFVKNWGSSDAGQFHFGIFADGQHQNIYIKQVDGKTPNVSDPDPFPVGEWQHAAVVCDGSKVRLYRNGIEVASTDYDGTLVLPPMNCIGIGAKLDNGCTGADTGAPGFWQGKMDDIGIWNRGLSPAEIQAIYEAGQAGTPLVQAVVVSRARLAFSRSANELTLSWAQAGYVLQENADISKADGWTDTQGGGSSPVTVPIANAGGKFYRLHKP